MAESWPWVARSEVLVSVLWGLSGKSLGGGFGPPTVKGAEMKGDLQGHRLGFKLVGFAGNGGLLVTPKGRLSGEVWATWLPGSSSGLIGMFSFAQRLKWR